MSDERSQRVDPTAHRVLAGVSRVHVLETLRAAGEPLDVQELAKRVDLHPNTVRSHLDQLVEAGLVRRQSAADGKPGRPRMVYVPEPVREQAHEDSSGYRLLAEILSSYLAGRTPEPGSAAATAGRAWGRALTERPAPFEKIDAAEATDRVVDLLDAIGFEPEVAEEGQHVRLHRCPFREVAERHPDVVCGVHLGLMQGALAELGAPVEATRLDAFVEPELCLAHLTDEEETA